MWKDNIIALRQKAGKTNKQIEKGTGINERTVARIFSKKTEDCKRGHSMDNIVSIVNFLGGSLDEVFEDTGAIVGGRNYIEMQEKINALITERDTAIEENISLKTQITALTHELLHTQISHKDEIISLYKLLHEIKNSKE